MLYKLCIGSTVPLLATAEQSKMDEITCIKKNALNVNKKYLDLIPRLSPPISGVPLRKVDSSGRCQKISECRAQYAALTLGIEGIYEAISIESLKT